ncbi:MAG: ABC transporter substrate-binding protein [Mogibacterium sp.]|nr:ABC transporter substrate-binding protein [Mogibacterium sp.]
MKTGRKIKSIICLMLLIVMVLPMTGCTTFDSFRHAFLEESSEDAMPVITIGVFEPQTGSNAVRGKEEIKGIELANSIYSNVDGYKIVLSKVDTQSKVSAATTAIQGLIEMKPVAIIGSAGESTSLAAADYIQEAKMPTITPSATNPLITQSSSYYFRACITESQMGEGLAEYAYKELASRNIGIISLKNDSSTASLIDGFGDKIKAMAKKKSKAIKYSTEININEDEMKEALKAVRKANCNVCFVSLGTEAMDTFFTLAEEADMTGITYLGTRSWGSSDFVTMMKKHENIKVVFPYASVITDTSGNEDNLTEEAQRFQIEYQNRYGSEDLPTEYAALGYDSYLLIINAIHNAKSLEGKDIREAMLALKDLKGVTGVFSFDDRGNVVRTVNLSTIRDNTVVSEYVTKSEAEAKELEEIETIQNAEGN